MLCAFGLFFFPNVDRALLGFRRALRPGGTVALATFTDAGSRSIDRTWALIGRYAEVPPPADPAMRFDDDVHVGEVLGAAGFVGIEIHVEPYAVVLANPDAWWHWIRAMEFREHVDRLPATEQADLRASALREFGAGELDTISFPMDALFSRATTPK